MKNNRSQEYRRLAAESRKLAATTDDANTHAEYAALAEMWTRLAEEAETRPAAFERQRTPSGNRTLVQQQEQAQPKKPDGHKR